MTAEIQTRKYTLEEYLKLEYNSERRHYFYKGKIAPMTYTSDTHGLIVSNIIGEFHAYTKKSDFRIYPSDRMLYVPDCDLNYYPDAMILKGEPQFHEHSKKMHATLNPYAIIEVLSDSTENKDKVDKWKCYRLIPSLREYILVSQKEKYVEKFTRLDEVKWENVYVRGEDATITIAGFELKLEDIYYLVNFEEPKEEEE